MPDFDDLFSKMPHYPADPEPRLPHPFAVAVGTFLVIVAVMAFLQLPDALRSYAPAHVEGMP